MFPIIFIILYYLIYYYEFIILFPPQVSIQTHMQSVDFTNAMWFRIFLNKSVKEWFVHRSDVTSVWHLHKGFMFLFLFMSDYMEISCVCWLKFTLLWIWQAISSDADKNHKYSQAMYYVLMLSWIQCSWIKSKQKEKLFTIKADVQFELIEVWWISQLHFLWIIFIENEGLIFFVCDIISILISTGISFLIPNLYCCKIKSC